MSATDRSRRLRERRRAGLILVPVHIAPAHRRALEAMGLIEPGRDKDPAAVAWAVERFLDTAPAVQAIGDVMYREE